MSVGLSMIANSRSQFLLDRLGGCLKLLISTDSTSSHELMSQFGLKKNYTEKTPKSYREERPSGKCLLNEAASDPLKRGVNAGHGRSIDSDKERRQQQS